MTTPRELLMENNPFYTGTVGNPWDDQQPDVPGINCGAFVAVRGLIRQKAKNPSQGYGALVLGEAGAGKTHLLKRILAATRQDDTLASFAYVRPVLDVEAPLRYLLREIVINLCKELSEQQTDTQLDRFVAEILYDFLCNGQDPSMNAKLLQRLEGDRLHIFRARIKPEKLTRAMDKAIGFLCSQNPDLDKTTLKVLARYRQQDLRGLVIEWLKGEILDEEDASLLGVPSRENATDSAREFEARKILITFGLLMERYRLPMLVCFDQLDCLHSEASIRALENMVQLLVNDVHAMLPIAFARPDSWDTRFRGLLDTSTRERLESNRLHLTGCSVDEAKEIVDQRIRNLFGDDDGSASTWLWGMLEGRVKQGYSPRQVITLANRTIFDPPSPDQLVSGRVRVDRTEQHDAVDVLAEAYRNEVQQILSDFAGWPADGKRLRLALDTFLEAHGSVHNLRRDRWRLIDFSFVAQNGSGKDQPCAVSINTTRGHSRTGAVLRRCIAFLEANPSARCFYVTDERCPFPDPPRWPATNELRADYKRASGRMLFLTREQAARWYALYSLQIKIENGDLSMDTAGNALRAITLEDLRRFVQDKLDGDAFPPLLDLFERQDPEEPAKPATPPPDPDRVLEAVKRCLSASPMKMAGVSHLLGSLAAKESITTTEADLLALIGRHKATFRRYENKQGLTVGLV